MAEVVRSGLQAIPKGQYEGAMAVGLSFWQTMNKIILPQALKISIPNIVGNFISLFKDTTLVSIIGLFDLLGIVQGGSQGCELGGAKRHANGLFLAGSDVLDLLFRDVAIFNVHRAQAQYRTQEVKNHGSNSTKDGGERRGRDPDFRHEQVVRRVPRAARYQPDRLQGRAHRHLRPIRLGKVDADPLHQPAGRTPEGRHRGRWHSS